MQAASDRERQNKTPQVACHLRRLAGAGGEGGIRTRGGVTLTRFPIVRIRPDYATSPRSVRRGHYTIVDIECQIFVAVEAVVGGRRSSGVPPGEH
jgi:hypothetical protein